MNFMNGLLFFENEWAWLDCSSKLFRINFDKDSIDFVTINDTITLFGSFCDSSLTVTDGNRQQDFIIREIKNNEIFLY